LLLGLVICLGLGFSKGTHASSFSSSDVIAIYPLNDPQTGYCKDYANSSNDLTISGTIATTTGEFGLAGNFGNAGSLYATNWCNDRSISWSSPLTDFAISFWYKSSSAPATQGVVMDFNGNGLTIQADGTLRWCDNLNSDWICIGTAAGVVDFDGAWHHYVFAGSMGSSFVSSAKVYKDTTHAASSTATSLLSGTSGNANNATKSLGTSKNIAVGATSGDNWGIPGDLDDVALIQKAPMTDDDLLALQTCAAEDVATGACSTGGIALAITSQTYHSDTNYLILEGTCDRYGSGVNQMWAYTGYLGNITDMRGLPVSCGLSNTFYIYWDTSGMPTGTTTFFVDDSFYHPTSSPNAVSVEQYLQTSATNTLDWTGSVGYMSQDDPANSAKNLACTDAEWNTPDPVLDFGFATTSIPFFNLTRLKCQAIKALYIVAFGIRNTATTLVKSAGSQLAAIFPFNIPVKIKESWDASASSTMPGALSWLDITDASGNAYIYVPHDWTGQASDTPVLVWGTDVFTPSGSTSATLFGHIRSLSTYLLWAMFIWGVWNRARKIYAKIDDSASSRNIEEDV